MEKTFRDALTNLINYYSKENGSNTPDFILAEYLDDCLKAFDKASTLRQSWHSKDCPTPETPQPHQVV